MECIYTRHKKYDGFRLKTNKKENVNDSGLVFIRFHFQNVTI